MQPGGGERDAPTGLVAASRHGRPIFGVCGCGVVECDEVMEQRGNGVMGRHGGMGSLVDAEVADVEGGPRITCKMHRLHVME